MGDYSLIKIWQRHATIRKTRFLLIWAPNCHLTHTHQIKLFIHQTITHTSYYLSPPVYYILVSICSAWGRGGKHTNVIADAKPAIFQLKWWTLTYVYMTFLKLLILLRGMLIHYGPTCSLKTITTKNLCYSEKEKLFVATTCHPIIVFLLGCSCQCPLGIVHWPTLFDEWHNHKKN